jgi:hypothetical protein
MNPLPRGFRRRSIYLILISLALIMVGSIVLTHSELKHFTITGSFTIKPQSYNYTRINLINGDRISINVSSINSTGEFQVYLSPGNTIPVHEGTLNVSDRMVENITFNYPSGEYYLIVYNNGDKIALYSYSIDLYRVKHVEMFSSAVSLSGVILLIISLILLYMDIVSYYSEKYPEIRSDKLLHCRSIKLNKHSCTVKIPLPYMVEEISNRIEEYFGGIGYKTRKKFEELMILERSQWNPFSKKKPALLMIHLDPYRLEFYYTIPHSRAAGTIDLAWIFNEVRGFVDKLLEGEGGIHSIDEEESRVKHEDD